MPYSLSLWPLNEAGQFTDTAPAYESRPWKQRRTAKGYFDTMTHGFACNKTRQADCAFLLCIDELDADGFPQCVEKRRLTPPA